MRAAETRRSLRGPSHPLRSRVHPGPTVMSRLLPLAVLLLVLPMLASAGKRGPASFPERMGDRFGFVTRSGRLLIHPNFDMVTPFRDGRAAAMRNGRWGFIDTDGRWVGQPRYDWLHPQHFDEGPALVSVNGLYGFVGRDGAQVVPLYLEQATPFDGGYACLFEPHHDKFGIIDAKGQPVSGFTFDECDAGFHDGRARVRQGSRWGYVDKNGALVLPVIYDHAEPFSEGLALVEEAGLRAYIDPSGQRVIPANVASAGRFSQGRAWVRYGPDQVGFIDRTGTRVGPATWRAARDFSEEGVAWVEDPATGRWALMDRDGAVVVPPTYEDPGPFSEGLARVGLGGRYGFVDASGELVIPIRYESVGTFHEGLVTVASKRGGKYGVLDRSGQVVVEERYDQIGPFHGGVARVTTCRLHKKAPLGPEVQVCDVFFVDRTGRERRREAQ